jgi:hypothetical protein
VTEATAPGPALTGRAAARKVRTAQGTVLDNVQAGRPDGKCNRKIPLGELPVASYQLPVVEGEQLHSQPTTGNWQLFK